MHLGQSPNPPWAAPPVRNEEQPPQDNQPANDGMDVGDQRLGERDMPVTHPVVENSARQQPPRI